LTAGEIDEASKELASLQAVFPGHPKIQNRIEMMELFQPQDHLQDEHSTQKAMDTLEMLLAADDLLAALAEHRDLLDQDLLELVRINAAAARADGDQELAEGLDNLATYLEEVNAQRA
jgi:hypothetical protein